MSIFGNPDAPRTADHEALIKARHIHAGHHSQPRVEHCECFSEGWRAGRAWQVERSRQATQEPAR